MPLFLRLEKTAKTGETVQESQRASFSTAENNGGNGITVQEARHASFSTAGKNGKNGITVQGCSTCNNSRPATNWTFPDKFRELIILETGYALFDKTH